jgi:hypothetical protein
LFQKPSGSSAATRPPRKAAPLCAGVCEAQLWTFSGPANVSSDDPAREVYWVAAASLDEALRYLRQRYDDLQIMEARCAGMVALVSGSPLD